MKYFIDTEFIEYPFTIDLISIGIVAEDDRCFYAVSSEFNENMASQWVKDNVLFSLSKRRITRERIKQDLLEFVGNDKPEFWGYYADYDWVVFCWLFGTMIELPEGWPMYCRDIKQWCDELGNPILPKQNNKEHHALDDAMWNKIAWEFLNNIKS
jgi:hypothetical protein